MGKIKTQESGFELNDVLKGCSRGDLKAQEHLYKNYYGYVMGVALHFSSSHDNALEIANDSFLKVFKNIEFHQVDKEFRAWIRRIVINTAIDYYRRDKKKSVEILLDEAYNESTDESVIDQLNAEEIIKLINSLPMNYRYTFSLYEIEGFTHDEIAQKLGITASSSRSNLTRAKKILRQMIQTNYSYERVV